MSTFEVKAYPVTIETHPDPEVNRLEVARIGGYTSVVRRGRFRTGDRVLFIPPQAIVPEAILKSEGLWDEEKNKGRLRGPEGNRLMPSRLRGVLSEGLCYVPRGYVGDGVGMTLIGGVEPPVKAELDPNKDYAEELGIVKWVPTLPSHAAGNVYYAMDLTSYTDMENGENPYNIQGDPAFNLVLGEEVVMSEKLHGSCCIMFLDSESEFHVSSKGNAAQQRALEKPENPTRNWYWYAAHRYDIEDKLRKIKEITGARLVTLYGEVYGNGVQDLQYGLLNQEKNYRAFDLKLDREYVDYDRYIELMNEVGIETVPYLFRGVCDMDTIIEHRDGQSTLDNGTIREGVVIRPVIERHDNDLGGRVLIKAVSPAYRGRRGGSEYN